jgi:Chaperone of endosialidase
MSSEPVSRISISAESGVPEVIVGNETLSIVGETGSVIKTQVTATDSILIGFEPAVGGLIGAPLVAGDMVVSSDGKYHAIPNVSVTVPDGWQLGGNTSGDVAGTPAGLSVLGRNDLVGVPLWAGSEVARLVPKGSSDPSGRVVVSNIGFPSDARLTVDDSSGWDSAALFALDSTVGSVTAQRSAGYFTNVNFAASRNNIVGLSSSALVGGGTSSGNLLAGVWSNVSSISTDASFTDVTSFHASGSVQGDAAGIVSGVLVDGLNHTGGGSSSNTLAGVMVNNMLNTATTQRRFGVYVSPAAFAGTGGVSITSGAEFDVNIPSGSSSSVVSGVNAYLGNQSSVVEATVVRVYGYGSGSATSSYGVRIIDVPNGTSNRIGLSVEQPLARSFFAGNVTVGSSLVPSGSNKFRVEGTAESTQSSFNVISDERLKDNVERVNIDSRYALDSIVKLSDIVSSFTFKGSVDRQVGFVAQEVEKIVPEFVDVKPIQWSNGVVEQKDVDGQVSFVDDVISIDDGRVLDSTMINMFLLKAVAQLAAEVEMLKNRK